VTVTVSGALESDATIVISHGNRNSDEEIFSTICAALGPA
jgi:hypothetical protein